MIVHVVHLGCFPFCQINQLETTIRIVLLLLLFFSYHIDFFEFGNPFKRRLQLFVKLQNPLFPLTAILPWVILFRKRNQSTLMVKQKILPLSFAGRVSKFKRESLLPAIIKMFMLTSRKLFYTNFCARNQFLFGIKRLSKFLYRCFEI